MVHLIENQYTLWVSPLWLHLPSCFQELPSHSWTGLKLAIHKPCILQSVADSRRGQFLQRLVYLYTPASYKELKYQKWSTFWLAMRTDIMMNNQIAVNLNHMSSIICLEQNQCLIRDLSKLRNHIRITQEHSKMFPFSIQSLIYHNSLYLA